MALSVFKKGPVKSKVLLMSEPETDKPDENEVLRRMLNMPPKPHEFGENKKGGQGKPDRLPVSVEDQDEDEGQKG